jgi:DNA-binding FadR family transcriptional regulator
MVDVVSSKPLSVRAQGARQLATYLETAIRSGHLREGVKLPAERELSEERCDGCWPI